MHSILIFEPMQFPQLNGSDAKEAVKDAPPSPDAGCAPKEGLSNKERKRARTRFQSHWLSCKDENGDYLSEYIVPDDNDKYRAICSVCYKSMKIDNIGKAAVMQHSRSIVHKERMKIEKGPKIYREGQLMARAKSQQN